ncbi:hypothetical protein COV25_00495 [candidate division WWE3 bacterium CG10_big_fil_rev_8_21_14_0_10_35_32]|nr:MAG: hypothetical protein COV25_00495 [candidate division WWE3 bacterium CG10_big_fil_rev_8_21_14_0_10_35_32]
MPEEKYNSYRNLAYLVIATLLVVGVYEVFNGFDSNKTVNKSEESPNAYFQPDLLKDQNKSVSGVIRIVPQMDNVRYEYGLYDEGGKLISYLTSSKIDFSLSDGLNVEVQGTSTVNGSDGYAIMEVTSVKLK